MKYLTMVMRSGDVKDNPNMMNYTLISDDLSIVTMSGTKLSEAINTKKVNVVNMAVSVAGLVSTNGSIKNYTTLDPQGNLVGAPKNVILGRIEVDGKLSKYQMFRANGTVANVSPAEAAALASKGLIANGKIRHTAEGDIVAAIGGTYPLIEVEIQKREKEKIAKPAIDIVFFGSALDKSDSTIKFGGITVTSTDAVTVARAHKILEEANAKLITGLKEHRGYTDEQLESFKIKVATGAGFYGVYPFESIRSLVNSVGSYKTSIGNVMIGCTDCSTPDFDESVIVYNTKSKSIIKSISGGAKSDKALKEYKDYVISNILK